MVDFDCLWAPDGGGLGWMVDSIHLGALSVPSRHDSLGSKHQAWWWIGITCPVLSVPSIKHRGKASGEGHTHRERTILLLPPTSSFHDVTFAHLRDVGLVFDEPHTGE